MIVVIDYGMGNTASLCNMVRKVGGKAKTSADRDEMAEADALILPGVGAFDHAMIRLRELGFVDVLDELVLKNDKPVLGVCLGMQLLLERSEEGVEPGLGWIPGEVIRFRPERANTNKLIVPHMGWNVLHPVGESELFSPETDEESRFYFVHSYHAECRDEANVLATANYGYEFTAAVRRDHIWGMQFHPEKSHRFGMQMFRRFIERVACSVHA